MFVFFNGTAPQLIFVLATEAHNILRPGICGTHSCTSLVDDRKNGSRPAQVSSVDSFHFHARFSRRNLETVVSDNRRVVSIVAIHAASPQLVLVDSIIDSVADKICWPVCLRGSIVRQFILEKENTTWASGFKEE